MTGSTIPGDPPPRADPLGVPLNFGAELWEDAAVMWAERPAKVDTLWGRLGYVGTVLLKFSGARLLLLYRLAHAWHHHGGAVGRGAAGALTWLSTRWYGCRISPRARIFGGQSLPHPQGIVIGPGAEVARRGWIFQNVTIAAEPGQTVAPRIGVQSRLFAGATIVGPITLGDSVQVGANAVVAFSVSDGARVLPPRPVIRLASDPESRT